MQTDSVVSNSDFLEDQVPPYNCLTKWSGRIVTHCPTGNYESSTYLKINSVLKIVIILSIGTLMIGSVWKDSMDDDQKIIITTIGIIGVVGSLICHAISSVVFMNQPSRNVMVIP